MAAPETDEPRIIDLDEGDIWQEHKGKVITSLLVTLALCLGGGWWYQHKTQREADAWNAYSEAKTPEARTKMLQEYAGSSAAATLLLQEAKDAIAKREFATAAGHFSAFIQSFPKHPARPAADLGQAGAEEAAGDAAAEAHYQAILDAQPEHPYRGASALGLARIYKSSGKTSEARSVLETYTQTASLDPFFSEAKRLLSTLPPNDSAEVTSPRPPQ
jgi:TolA-binding protein